tara:strand:+ start:169 stop:780 length:612 start_codon:yes stop_codon:yes gene_type:complete
MVGTVIAKVSGAAGGATLAVEGGTSSTTYELSKTDGSANDHLKTDGSGNLAWVAPPTAGTNTPAWHVGINSATQTIPDASQTIVELDDVKFNSGFTWDTVNYKGVPGTAGKYVISCFADLDPHVNGAGWVYLYKNTTSMAFWGFNDAAAIHYLDNVGGTTILDLGATDYVQMKVYIDHSTSGTIRQYDATQCVTYMSGFKLII